MRQNRPDETGSGCAMAKAKPPVRAIVERPPTRAMADEPPVRVAGMSTRHAATNRAIRRASRTGIAPAPSAGARHHVPLRAVEHLDEVTVTRCRAVECGTDGDDQCPLRQWTSD